MVSHPARGEKLDNVTVSSFFLTAQSYSRGSLGAVPAGIVGKNNLLLVGKINSVSTEKSSISDFCLQLLTHKLDN